MLLFAVPRLNMGDEGSLTVEQIAKWRVRRRDIQGLERLGEAPDAGKLTVDQRVLCDPLFFFPD